MKIKKKSNRMLMYVKLMSHEKNDFVERSKILQLDTDQKSNFIELSK